MPLRQQRRMHDRGQNAGNSRSAELRFGPPLAADSLRNPFRFLVAAFRFPRSAFRFPLSPPILFLLISASLLRAEEGLALAIVYDTSGSMRDVVRTTDGTKAAKYIVGNRALEQIIQRIDRYK